MFFVPAVNERTNGARSVFANQPKKLFSEYNSSCSLFSLVIYNTKNKKQKIKNQKIKNQKKIKGDEWQERNQTQGPEAPKGTTHQKVEAKLKKKKSQGGR